MKPSENIDTQRLSRALAFLKQKIKEVESVLESVGARKLMALNNLAEIPEQKREAVEAQLWSIFIYGKYPMKKILGELPAPTLKNVGNYTFYLNEYIPISKRLCELLDASMAPPRSAVEEWVDTMIDRYNYEDYENEIDRLNRYVDYALDGRLTSYIKGCIRRKKDDPKASFSENQEIKSSFVAAKQATCLLRGYVDHLQDDRLHRPSIDDLDRSTDTVAKELCDNDLKASNCAAGLHDYDPGPDNVHVKIINDLNKVIKESYFQPDEWVANKDDFSLFVTPKISTPKKRRPHIVERIREIHRSFIFGNWMSVIALSRCLLEYALRDTIINKKDLMEKANLIKQQSNGEIQICVVKDNRKQLLPLFDVPLQDLIKTVNKALSELKLESSMHTVRKLGNGIMHPSVDKFIDESEIPRIGKFPSLCTPGKNKAKMCVEEISKIISTLYSA